MGFNPFSLLLGYATNALTLRTIETYIDPSARCRFMVSEIGCHKPTGRHYDRNRQMLGSDIGRNKYKVYLWFLLTLRRYANTLKWDEFMFTKGISTHTRNSMFEHQ